MSAASALAPKPKPASWKVDLGTGSYISFDYQGEISRAFPDPNAYPRKSRQRWLMAARRECRGLLVDASTGAVLARRFHKFFNLEARSTPLYPAPPPTELIFSIPFQSRARPLASRSGRRSP